jgi:1-acyl-sn-glycerol-3-phosphate acyltransferase
MTRAGILARVLVLVLAFLCLLPVQALASWAGWRLAGILPTLFHRLILALFGIRVHVQGLPPQAGRPTLVLANHVSWLDIPAVASTVPLSFIAKSEIADWPVFGFLARLQRSVFLDRARKSATAEVNDVVAERLARGEAIVLFPEGTTGDGNRLLPFRSSLVGAARAALVGQGGAGEHARVEAIHLQPLALAYTRRNGMPVTRRERPGIAWYGDMDLLPHLAAFFREGPIDVVLTWGEPLVFDARTNRKHATAAVEAAIRAAIRDAIGAR